MTGLSPYKVAAVQTVSTPKVEENLVAAGELVAQAAGQGAKLVALPEYFCIFGMRERDKVAAREKDGAGPIQGFLSATAKRHGVWLVGGSVPLESSDPGKVRNSCLVYDAAGRRVARYDKIHLFGFEMGAERFNEANTIEAGDTPLAIDSPFGRIALSVCYDVRFPELYRALAPAQGGKHANGRETHGHSMIVDPWGKIVAERATGPGVIVAEIDPAYQAKVRASLPALDHRRFGLTRKGVE